MDTEKPARVRVFFLIEKVAVPVWRPRGQSPQVSGVVPKVVELAASWARATAPCRLGGRSVVLVLSYVDMEGSHAWQRRN